MLKGGISVKKLEEAVPGWVIYSDPFDSKAAVLHAISMHHYDGTTSIYCNEEENKWYVIFCTTTS